MEGMECDRSVAINAGATSNLREAGVWGREYMFV